MRRARIIVLATLATVFLSVGARAWAVPAQKGPGGGVGMPDRGASAIGAGRGVGATLVVVVPPVPPRNSLTGLCHGLLAGVDTPAVTVLVGATGGTRPAAVSWCRAYLHSP